MRTLFLMVTAAACAFAQLDSNTITVTASRSVQLAPDQITFVVTVTAPTTASLDDVLAAAPGLGLTAANLSGVQATLALLGPASTNDWSFNLTVAISQLKSTLATITALQGRKSGMSVSFLGGNTAVSDQAAAAQTCTMLDLFLDASAQAQKLASAAGRTVGTVLALSNPPAPAPTPVLANRAGAFVFSAIPFVSGSPAGTGSSLASFLLGFATTPALARTPVASCTMTVKFQLIRTY